MKYFIAYAYFLKNNAHGFGNIEVDRSWPIAGVEDITELTAHINDSVSRAMGRTDVSLTIISWQKFEDDIPRKKTDDSGSAKVVKLTK